MKLRAYAKINLGLKVIGKREDGYHNLEMIMINVNLFDTLKFKLNSKINVSMNKNICEMEKNIVYKTAKYIKEKYNVEKGVNIIIHKRIPDGGGMGGGSSDAATTIIALNKLWDLKLTRKDMYEIAEHMGSDVPFFILNRLAVVKGRGEIVEPINKNIDSKIIIVLPNMKCSTKEIFENYVKEENENDINDIYNALDNEYYKFLFNDLEKTVMNLYPGYILKNIKNDVEKKFDCKVLMSGSGSSFFVLGKKRMNNIYKYIRKQYPDLNIIKNKTISYCKHDIN